MRDLRTEKRFSGPALLHDHNVVSGMSVLLGSPEKPWGVLGTHTVREVEFNVDDVNFLVAVANCLTAAIHSGEVEDSLRLALTLVEQSERQLQAITNAMPGLMAVFDREHRYEFVNSAYEKHTGRKHDAIIGKTIEEVLGKSQSGRIRPQLDKTLAGEIVRFEKVLDFPDRERVAVMVHYVPRTDEEKNVTGVYALITDVSELKEKQQQILEWKNRYETAITASGQMLYDWNPNADTVTWGGDTRRVLGFKRNEMGTRLSWWLQRIHPEDRASFREQLLDQAPNSPLVRLEYRVCHRDGHYVPVEDRGDFVNAPEGRIARAIGFVEEVTDRRIAEEARARLVAIVESSSDGIFGVDTDGVILSWNRGAEQLFGRSADATIGELIDSVLPESDFSEFKDSLERALNGESIAMLRIALTRDSQTIDIAMSLSPLRNATDQVTGVATIARDISDRIRLEADEAMLKASNEERQRIGQDLHDGIGQELTGLAMLSQTLADTAVEESTAADAGRIASGIRDAQNSIRHIARGLAPVELDAQGLMAALEDLAEHTAKLSSIGCDFECPDEVIVSDNEVATHLYRIAQEAVTNAVRHADASRIAIRLRTESLEAETPPATISGGESDSSSQRWRLTLIVEDDGSGLVSETTKTGNGLRIMRHRAERLGGTFEVLSPDSSGTHINCHVPVS